MLGGKKVLLCFSSSRWYSSCCTLSGWSAWRGGWGRSLLLAFFASGGELPSLVSFLSSFLPLSRLIYLRCLFGAPLSFLSILVSSSLFVCFSAKGVCEESITTRSYVIHVLHCLFFSSCFRTQFRMNLTFPFIYFAVLTCSSSRSSTKKSVYIRRTCWFWCTPGPFAFSRSACTRSSAAAVLLL